MTISPALIAAYRFHRDPYKVSPRGFNYSATSALANARRDVEAEKTRYASSHWSRKAGNGEATDGKRWIENPESVGLRFAGYADEIDGNIRHRGWFIDSYQDAKYRGVVYQLPGKNGLSRFVVGHDDSDNRAADNGGPAYVDFSTIYESDFADEMRQALASIGKAYRTPDMLKPAYWAEAAHETAKREAARMADSFAESEAEKAREYNEAWECGLHYADAIEERAEAKAALRALLAERRAMRSQASASTSAICDAIAYKARGLIDDLRKANERMAACAQGSYGELYFDTNDSALRHAFNDAAGAAIL